jgi:signal transduction histidine kinase
LNGLRQLSHDLGVIRAIAVYTSLNGGYLSTVDLRQLERALARLEELIPQVEGQIQALASRTGEARLRQQWRTTHAELESYLQWSRQTLLLPSRVTVTWQEALAEGGDRQQRLRDLSEDITGVAVMLVEQGRGKSLRDSGLIAAGLLVLYLLVLVLSLVFFHFATRAIRGRAEVRAKSQFLARMSHEIRTPLNGVLGLAELLRETNPSPRQQEYIGLIENAGRTLNTLVNDVLDYAKLEAGKLELEQAPFDPAALLIDCAHMFSLPASDNGDLVLVDADADLPAQLRGDAPRLRQVLTNLLSNAIKFTRHGWIRVGARCLEQRDGRAMIEFTVSDSGIGMTREEQRRLFQNFSQASASVAQRFGGTGLGLSISQELVRLMGGEIELRSAPEQGATFRFVIPLPVLEKAVPMPEWTSVPALVWDPVGNLGELLQRDPRFSRVRVVDDLAAVQRALSEDDSGHLLVNGVSDGVLLDQGLRPARERHAGLRPVLLCGMRESGEVVMRDDITLVRRAVLTVTELQQLISDSGPGQVPLLSEREPVDTQGGLRVLVAEDNPVNQMVTRGYLERLGVPGPVLSDDGRKALEAFTAGEGRYRLVLMDLDMPDMDGFESATRMRRLEQEKGWPPAVILALSAHVLPEYAGRIHEAGMDGQLIKPLTLSAMQAALHQYLTDS